MRENDLLRCPSERRIILVVTEWRELQALVYDILPSTTATVDYDSLPSTTATVDHDILPSTTATVDYDILPSTTAVIC